jgi:hypothetical protein
MKKIWMTSLVRDQGQVGSVLKLAETYGLAADGHFWTDDLAHMAWLGPEDALTAPETALWVILGSKKEVDVPSVRYGLALLALRVQGRKGNGFPVLWLTTDEGLTSGDLPTPLQGAEVLPAGEASLGAKLTARANVPPKPVPADYRLAVHANPGFGVWFEVGPGQGATWTGALLGVDQGAVDAHGVGPAGAIPQKAVLEYPVQGLKLSLGEREYTAWAVQNGLDHGQSYYARVQEVPGGLLFGPYSQEDEADVHVITF